MVRHGENALIEVAFHKDAMGERREVWMARENGSGVRAILMANEAAQIVTASPAVRGHFFTQPLAELLQGPHASEASDETLDRSLRYPRYCIVCVKFVELNGV